MKQAGGVLGEDRDLKCFLQKTTLVMPALPPRGGADPVAAGLPRACEGGAVMPVASQQ